jgi:hypothetical protein
LGGAAVFGRFVFAARTKEVEIGEPVIAP